MTALHFDTLLYTNQLIEAGVPPEVAQVHAQTLRQAFGFYVDDLVTKSHLDARLAETDARIEQRFADAEVRMEQRFTTAEVHTEQRFSSLEIRMEQRFSGIENRLSRLEVSVKLLMAVMIAGVILPNLLLTARLFAFD